MFQVNVMGTYFTFTILHLQFDMFIIARVAELVDALVSGTSIRKGVQVRVLFRAQ
jgi:hypothetical protein